MLSSIPFHSCPVILNTIEPAVLLRIEDNFVTSFKNSQRTATLPFLASVGSSGCIGSLCGYLKNRPISP